MPAHVTRTLRARARRPGGVEILASLRHGLTEAQQEACLRSLELSKGARRLFGPLGLIRARLGERALLVLAAREEVVRIEAAPTTGIDPIVERRKVSQAALAEEAQARTWGINRLSVPAAWERGALGAGVVVAHLDTGLHEAHRAFRGRIKHRAVIDRKGNLHHTSTMVDTHGNGHGTHTAGTICGREVGGRRVGIAPFARLATATVMEGGDLTARVLRGLAWVLELEDPEIRVLNLSLGFRGWQPAFKPVMARIRAAGILPVASVGNDGPGTSRSPGNYRSTLSVGASDRAGKVWRYSSSNRWSSGRMVPDLVAPGVLIASASSRSTTAWRLDRGTSMATAHVSGLAALLFSHRPDATVDQVEESLFSSCARLTGVPSSRQGLGLPDAARALDALASITARDAATKTKRKRAG